MGIFSRMQWKVGFILDVITKGRDTRDLALIIYIDDISVNSRVNTKNKKFWSFRVLPATCYPWYRAKENNWWTVFAVPGILEGVHQNLTM